MRRTLIAATVVVGLSGSPLLAESQDFHIVNHSVSVDDANRTAEFSVTFDQTPTFFAVNGGQLKAFQYEVDAHSTSLDSPIALSDVDSIIRGGEIWEGNGIPVRESTGEGGAGSGGWGPIRALLDYQIDDKTVKFTTTWADLGDADGKFRYRLFATDMGGTTSSLVGTSAVPLPLAGWSGLGTLATVGLVAHLRKRRLRKRRENPWNLTCYLPGADDPTRAAA